MAPRLPVELRKKRQREKQRKPSLFQKKNLQNFEIKDILEELSIPSESYFVTSLSILVE
jgi:hypothetical protein